MQPVQVSAKHKLVGVPFDVGVRNLFPQAKEFDWAGAKQLLVPHGPVETFLLRRMGFDVPSPILTHYPWPHPAGQPPFDAQKKTSALLTVAERAYVLNDKGTGKTRSALWGYDYLRGNGLCGKMLVLAPLSTLNFTWAREVFTTTGHLKCAVLHGTKKRRLGRLADPTVDVFIINHDGVGVIYDELVARTDIDVLVIDEFTVYKNPTAQCTKRLKKLATRMRWVWAMSGAPIPNSPTDVWSPCAIVTPHTVPKYFGRFRDELMLKVTQFKFAPKADAVDRAFAVMQPAVRFTLDDVQELPPYVERYVDVEMGPKQAKVYKELAETAYAAIQSEEITAANAGAVLNKLLQVSTGWVYTRDGNTIPLDNDKRIQHLIDEINATSRKCMVFVPFKHALAGIAAALTKEGIEHAVVSGDTLPSEREQTFNLFQNTAKYRVLVAHPKCLAHGLTLTAADTIIWFAPITSLEIYDQANGRIRRVGQQHKQLFLHLQSTPIEKRVYRMLAKKQKVQSDLLALFEAATE